jgi:hypothetical protein
MAKRGRPKKVKPPISERRKKIEQLKKAVRYSPPDNWTDYHPEPFNNLLHKSKTSITKQQKKLSHYRYNKMLWNIGQEEICGPLYDDDENWLDRALEEFGDGKFVYDPEWKK